MYLRCPACDALTWLKSLEPGKTALSSECGNCEREFSLITAGELGTTDEEQNQRALAYAEYHRIDVPSAYSVLLGIMALEDALNTREARVTESRSRPGPELSAEIATGDEPDEPDEEVDADEHGFDPGFAEAVTEGFLTADAAKERGERKALASYLAGLHRLPLRLAYKVADNRITLAEATLIVAQNPELKPTLPKKSASRREVTLAVTLAALVVAGIGIQAARIWREVNRPPFPRGELALQQAQAAAHAAARKDAERPRRPPADLRTGDDGELLRVEAPDPSSVLRSYCSSGPGAARREPIELAPDQPPFPGIRIGVYRDLDRLNSRYTIRIVKDRGTSRWVAGDGTGPIPTMPAPDYLKDVERIPVEPIQDESATRRDS
jgi:hypothetical protein